MCPKFLLAEAIKIMDIDYARNLERMDPRPPAPWSQLMFDTIDAGDNGGEGEQKIINLVSAPETVVFLDASAKKSNLGAAAVVMDDKMVMADQPWSQ